MTERIDHITEARAALEGAGDGRNFATDASAAALVHATLALVEQQRIANLIAFAVDADNAQVARDLAAIEARSGLGL